MASERPMDKTYKKRHYMLTPALCCRKKVKDWWFYKEVWDIIKKQRIQIAAIVFAVICIYILNQIAFFHDKEFERAVRDTLESPYMSFTSKRNKPILGIVWKKDLENIIMVSLDLREYHVKNISDIRYFKDVDSIWSYVKI